MASETIRINPADPSELLPEDESQGEWVTKEKAASAKECSVRTIESLISDRAIPNKLEGGRRKVFLKHPKRPENRSDQAPKPSETNFQNIRNISETSPQTTNDSSDRAPHDKCVNCDRLGGQVSLLDTQLTEERVAKAKLEGQMEGKDDLIAQLRSQLADKDDLIAAKDQTIEAKNGAFYLLEQQLDKGALPTRSFAGISEGENPAAAQDTVLSAPAAPNISEDIPKPPLKKAIGLLARLGAALKG